MTSRTLLTAAALALAAPFSTVALPAAASAQMLLDDERAAAYQTFVVALQEAVAEGDSDAVMTMVRLPLRVNDRSSGELETTIITTRQELAERHEWVFDAAFRQAVAAQDPADIFSTSEGAMIGSGEVWFEGSCVDEDCTKFGNVRIFAVNRLPPQ